jgi:hypothetical protein
MHPVHRTPEGPLARRYRATPAARAWPGLLLGLATVLLAGCLGEPGIDEQWTRIDIEGSNIAPNSALAPDTLRDITVSTALTYRSIITGFAVADLRASGVLGPGDVEVHPDASRLTMAHDIDRVLANSVSVGRATRAITGWNHLIQRIDFSFTGWAPAAIDTSVAPPGSTVSYFLVCYLGEGDEVERQDGTDTLIVTPFKSDEYKILPIGMELVVRAPATP